MALPDIVRAVTATPAKALARPDLGDLSVGSTGDATVMRIEEGRFTLRGRSAADAGRGVSASRWTAWSSAGALWHAAGASKPALAAD